MGPDVSSRERARLGRLLAVILVASSFAGCGISQRLAQPSGARTPAPRSTAPESEPVPSGAPGQPDSLGVGRRYERPPLLAPPVWQTFSTDHLVIHTNLNLVHTRDLIARTERVRTGLALWFASEAAANPAASPGAMEMVLFNDAVEYQQRFGGTVASRVDMPDGREVLITHAGQSKAEIDEVIVQGLVRQFLRTKFPSLPAWLGDGLAAYLGRAKADETRLWLGAPSTLLGPSRDLGDIAPMDELIAGGTSDVALPARTRRNSAWALIGYLLDPAIWGDQADARLFAWLALVSRGGPAPPVVRRAFSDVYPERSLEDVSAGYRGHARSVVGLQSYQRFIVLPPAKAMRFATAATEPERTEFILLHAEALLAIKQPHVNAAIAAADARWWLQKPRHQIRVTSSWLEPLRPVSLAYGFSFLPSHAADLEVGKDFFGHFLSSRYRYEIDVGHVRTMFTNFSIGPQLALKNKTLGLAEALVSGPPPDGPTRFHHLSVAGEVALGFRVWHGLMVRTGVTLLLRLASNLDKLCSDPRFRQNLDCPEVSQQGAETFGGSVRLGVGYAF